MTIFIIRFIIIINMAKVINKINNCCPVCEGAVKVRELYCEACALTLRGEFAPGLFSGLTEEDQQFVFNFVLTGGSLKAMAKHLGKSYPTVRSKLDSIIGKMKHNGRKSTE